MTKVLWNSLLAAPALFGAVLAASTASAAELPAAPSSAAPASLEATVDLEQLNRYSREGSATRSQVTSVSELSDVQPTDWAFQALQLLIERYGCIAGYPDGTFKGNRALTRYEFAAGLYACLNRINEIALTTVSSYATKEDLAVLQKLQEVFASELATLRGRVDTLEARTSFLEKTQFSTTTKLTGEAIMSLNSLFNSDDVFDGGASTVFQNRVRLNFNTSFTGKDLLITRLQVGNAQTYNREDHGYANEAVLTSQVFGNTGSQVTLDTLLYQFPLGEKARVFVAGNAGVWDDIHNTLNPYFENYDGGNGSLSAFAQRNPIYRIGGGAGLGLKYAFSNNFEVSLGYLAGTAANPFEGNGFFDGNYSATGQLTYTSTSKRFGLGVVYNHAYFQDGQFAFDNAGFGEGFAGTTLVNSVLKLDRISTSSVGLQGYYQFSPKVALTGYAGYTHASSKNDAAFDDADIWYYALGLALPDLFKEGSLGGIFVGAQPYFSQIDGDTLDNVDIPWHLEVFYKYALNDWISITPGVIWQFNPNQNSNNDDVVVGVLRTTFVF